MEVRVRRKSYGSGLFHISISTTLPIQKVLRSEVVRVPLSLETGGHRWNLPGADTMELNKDIAIRAHDNCIGIGAVIRNFRGEIMFTFCWEVQFACDPVVAKAIAVRDNLHEAIELGFFHLEIETDSLLMARSLNSLSSYGSEFG